MWVHASFLLMVGAFDLTCAQQFYVVAPNTLRLNSDETIAIAIDDNVEATVNVFVQDYPEKIKNISQTLVVVGPALIRIIQLEESLRLSNQRFLLQIRNPKNVILEEKYFNNTNRKSEKVFAIHVYKFPTYSVPGEWSATVRYGHNLEQNTTVRFELQEYVLPTFSVELRTPDVILPDDKTIQIEVKANYVYGKKVKGMVTFRVGVKSDHSPFVEFLPVIPSKDLDDGSYTLRMKTDVLKRNKDIGWFPEVEGSHLIVEATVIDAATGNKETAIDSKGRFFKTQFLISFKRCLKDFKPGLTSVFEADIIYVDGTPVSGIRTKIQVVSDTGRKLFIADSSKQSDENGKVSFEIQPELHHKNVTITLETDDPRFEGSQATGTFEQHAYQSKEGAYIAIDRSSRQKLKPGQMFAKEIRFHPARIQNIYYVVTSRGKIILMNKLLSDVYNNQRVQFQITHDMVPSFRIVVFTHHKDELIADSLKIEVERECNPNVQIEVSLEFGKKEPGDSGKIVIRGTEGTSVGLLGVDEAVYVLTKKDILTKAKVFNELAAHDLGCGSGGGTTINSVLRNAGLTVGTRVFTSSESAYSCVEIQRRKREAALDIVKTFSGIDKTCCSLGLEEDRHGRSCEERTKIVVKYLDGKLPSCAKDFAECCAYGVKNVLTDLKLMRPGVVIGGMGGQSIDEPEFIDAEFEEDFEKQLTGRNDFRETWIFDDVTIGPDNSEEYHVSLPHSITTWVLQAVSVSPMHGICVAEPQKLISFKKIFLHLNLPYSVVRNEQVEIQATVFNYGSTKIGVVVYIYGAKDLCSGTLAGEKGERKRLIIEGLSAATVTFPVIPLTADDFVIKVVALSPAGSDVVQRTLHVVPEGVTKEIDFSIVYDPTNQQRRQKEHIEIELYSDQIDPTHNLQVTAVKLASDGHVPGTTSCSITACDQIDPTENLPVTAVKLASEGLVPGTTSCSIRACGYGTESSSVKVRYNINVPVEDICKFDVQVNVTETETELPERGPTEEMARRRQQGEDMLPEDNLIRDMKKELDGEPLELDLDLRRRRSERASFVTVPKRNGRSKRQNFNENSERKLNISICIRYLGNKDPEMSIVDVGIFSGFEPVVEDLQVLSDDPSHLIQRYEKSSRGVVFYVQMVPIAENYCFSFHVVRQYIVENTLMSVIKVHDYYNPDAICTKFYSPGSNSPMLHTICEGGICECGEGGCPPKNPFSDIADLSTAQRRRELLIIFCENYDYVWKGNLKGSMGRDGGFFNISFEINDVIKAGIEKAEDIENETRTLLARDNCQTAILLPGQNYLILGTDGQKYMNANGDTWLPYLLDKTSLIHMWTSIKAAENKNLQRDLYFVTRQLKEKGCDL